MRIFSSCIDEWESLNLTVNTFQLETNEFFTVSGMINCTGFLMSGIITLFTVFANALTIFVLVCYRPLQKSVSNLYILSLSIADGFIGLFIMPVMSVYYFVQSLEKFFGPFWLCHVWQIADFAVSTISLYSICAIALDRFWNLEKPLRVFKRSRKIAKRLIITIWVIPFTIWAAVYYLFNTQIFSTENIYKSSDMATVKCYTRWSRSYIPILIAAPVIYIPVIILITMFVRIAMVVAHHMKFLRENANKPSINGYSCPDLGHLINLNSNSKTRDCSTKSPDIQRKLTDNSLQTLTSGYFTMTIKSSKCQSPRIPKHEWNLTPLREERSNGRERRHSEQIQQQFQEIKKGYDAFRHFRVQSTEPVSVRKQSFQANEMLLINQSDTIFKNITSEENFFNLPNRANWLRSSFCSTDSGIANHPQSDSRKASRVSMRLKRESKRFSIIPLPHNILEIMHREGVSQQVRAAKAVALILSCFLLCWLPFLILWPLKIYCSKCIPDQLYMISIWLNYIGSALNPVVYTLSSPKARAALQQYLKQRSSFRCRSSMFKSITML